MEKLKLAIVLLFISCFSFAQNDELIRSGLLSVRLTYSPSYLFENNTSHYYLHGNIEGYVNNKISIAGEGYYFLANGSINEGELQYNHSAFFGASYHFTRNKNDFYMGIQPGLAFTKYQQALNSPTFTRGVNPLFSTLIGYNLYFYKCFHFFIQGRLILGEHIYYPTHNLNEFRLSAGLGFNLNTLKISH